MIKCRRKEMINDQFDNRYGMNSDEALNLIKSFFASNLSICSFLDEYNEKTGYWGIKYSCKNISIFISSGRGFFEFEITKDGKEISLVQFDPGLKNVVASSEKNILYTLDVIKKFVDTGS